MSAVIETRNLTKTSLPPLRLSGKWISDVVHWAISPPRAPKQKFGSSFANYLGYGLSTEMIAVFEATGATTMAIDHYVQGQPAGLSLSVISRTRTAVQKRILSLPLATELQGPNFPFVYEACRLTGLVYGIAVIFPIHNAYLVLQELVQKIKTALELAKMEVQGTDNKDLYL